jgi:hypothetical protein
MGVFLDKLRLEDIDGRTMRLLEPFRYFVSKKIGTVCAVAGFVTDFASVPRLFWILLPKCGIHNRAAVAHDWLYVRRRIEMADGFRVPTRSECDWILLQGLQDCGVSWWLRNAMWSAVRAGGWWVWAHGEGADPKNRLPSDYHVDTRNISVDTYEDFGE